LLRGADTAPGEVPAARRVPIIPSGARFREVWLDALTSERSLRFTLNKLMLTRFPRARHGTR